MKVPATRDLRGVLPPAILVGLAVALFAYLLARFPYDGFYGQDAYAYYHQAEALWRELTGQPQPEWALFSTNGIYWPIGYHLHLLPGFMLGMPEAGRIVTLALAALTSAVVYLLVGELWYSASVGKRVAAGLVAGLALLLTGTYTRTALSLMSDVPATFWGTLSVYCCVKAWPPATQPVQAGRANMWALACGVALGIAIMVRYSSALLIPALVAYVAARHFMRLRQDSGSASATWAKWQRQVLWAVLGVGVALLPQLAYALTHATGPGLRSWSLENILSTTVTGPDGSASYERPMLVFYLAGPVASSEAGFYSVLLLPLLAAGVWTLLKQRSLAIPILVFTWWFISILAYSGTTYQAHRFALSYMPVLAMLIGVGATEVISWLGKVYPTWADRNPVRLGIAFAALLVIVCASIGLVQGWRSVEQWAAAHASFNVQERQVVDITERAAMASGQEGLPRVVSFGFSAPLYHYTEWPILDFYTHDETDIAGFLAAPGPHLLVVPEESMETQWADTPSGARWRWIRETYELQSQGKAGSFTVYSIGEKR